MVADDLVDGSLQHAIDRTATGAPAPVSVPPGYWGSTTLGGVWTATDARGWSTQNLFLLVNGTACYGSDSCASPAYPWGGTIGLLSTGPEWTEGQAPCTNDLPFYCFEQ